jgi:hypothetical protein
MASRRGELIWAGGSALVALAIALLAQPLPPLLHAAEDEGWARGLEFGALTFVFWIALAALGFLRAKIAMGLRGVSAERTVEDEREALAKVREETLDLARDLLRIEKAMSERQEDFERRVRELESLAVGASPMPQGDES